MRRLFVWRIFNDRTNKEQIENFNGMTDAWSDFYTYLSYSSKFQPPWSLILLLYRLWLHSWHLNKNEKKKKKYSLTCTDSLSNSSHRRIHFYKHYQTFFPYNTGNIDVARVLLNLSIKFSYIVYGFCYRRREIDITRVIMEISKSYTRKFLNAMRFNIKFIRKFMIHV